METEILDDNNFNNIRKIEYAHFGSRLGASLLDMLITMIPIAPLFYFGYEEKNLMLLLLMVLISMLYKPIMEGVWGATLGKMIVGITVVDSDMDIIDLGQSIKKNAIYIISAIISLLSMFWLAGTEAFQESEGFLEAMMAGEESPYSTVSLLWSGVIFISCLAMLGSATKQTLHDKVANTYCVNNATFEYVE